MPEADNKEETVNSIVSNLLVLICVKQKKKKQKMEKVEFETSFFVSNVFLRQ